MIPTITGVHIANYICGSIMNVFLCIVDVVSYVVVCAY